MHKKGVYPPPRHYYPVAPKNFQQAHNSYYNTEVGSPQFQYIQKRTDAVCYTGGGGGANRVPLAPQYTSVAGPHPSSISSTQQTSQSPQLRSQTAGSLTSNHNNPHTSAVGTHQPVPHSQHLPHPHSAISQQHQHHPILSTVSGATGAIVNQVQQQQSSVAPGKNSASSAGPPHELNAQAIQQQPIQQQIPQGSVAGVALPGSVSSGHSIMYSPTNPNAHPQAPQSNAQVRRIVNGGQQYFHIGQSNATHIHASSQQHRQAIAHQQANMQGFPFTNIQPLVHPTHQHLYQFTTMSPHHRPGVAGGQHQYQPIPQTQQQYPQQVYPVQAPAMYYQHHQQTQPKVQTNQVPRERSRNIIPIIDPNTNKNILEGMTLANASKPSHTPSPVQSRESSASNTPAPGESLEGKVHSSDIPAQFALQVALQVDSSNQSSDAVDCSINNKEIQSSHSVINSNSMEKERLLTNLDCQIESPSMEIVQSAHNVPEYSVNKSGQPALQVSNLPPPHINTSSHPGMLEGVPPSQPPPQPQRPPKQPRNTQSAVSTAGAINMPANQSKVNPPQQQPVQQIPAKQMPHQGKHQSQPKNATQMPPNRSQNIQSAVYQSKVGPTSNVPQISKGASNIMQQQLPPQSKPIPPQQMIKQQPEIPSASKAVPHHMPPPQVQQISHHSLQQPQPPPQSQGPPHKSQTYPPQGHLTQSNMQSPSVESAPKNMGALQSELSQTSTHKMTEPSAVSKVGEKRPSIGEPATTEPRKDASNRQSSSKVDSQSLGTKKELTPEPGAKRGGKERKQDATDESKLSKETAMKSDLIESKVAQDSPVGVQSPQTSLGKPPPSKVQTEKPAKAATTTVPPPTPSQTQKLDGSPDVPTPTNSEKVPSSQKASVEAPKKDEPQTNHVEELKVSNEENHVALKPKSSSLYNYTYQEGQWSPDNPTGKLQYGRDFLLELQNNPLSKKRPDILPDIEVVLNGPINLNRISDGKPKVLTDFTPSFLQNANNRNRGSPFNQGKMQANRNSQQGKKMPRVIDIKLMGSAEVKLKTTENAWKPTLKKEIGVVDEELTIHETTIKKMRGILNKLTPDNFDKLVVQVRSLNVDKFETFDEIIGIIFEKALDEQAFSATYAELCKVLAQMSVKSQGKGDETKFKNVIISKCQTEFEKDKSALKREQREKENEAENSETKAALKAQLEYEEQQLRRRSVGNIRFIGELYKRKMLTSPIMMRIILGLLKRNDEESLECLCKLFTTIGKMLETSASTASRALDDLNEVFVTMNNLVHSKQTSSRVRFLLMDVVDLRANNWVPRREEGIPKTKAEVHEQIRKEELEQHMLLSHAIRKDDRDRKRGGGGRDGGGMRDGNRGGMMMDDSGWNLVGSANNRRGPFDSSRLKNNTFRQGNVDNNVVLKAGFSNWARGSSGGVKEEVESLRPMNRYVILDNQYPSGDGRMQNPVPPRFAPGGNSPNSHHRHGLSSYGSKSMPPPSEKENLIASVKGLSSLGDRSKPNSRASSREGSLARDSHAVNVVPMSSDDAMKFSKSIIEEYAANVDLKEATLCVKEKFQGDNIQQFVNATLEWVVDRDADKRKKIGILFHHLLSHKALSVDQLIQGSKDVLEFLPDYVIDIPQVYMYMGEVLCRMLVLNVFTFKELLKMVQPANKGMVPTFTETVKQASKLLGESVVADLWKASELSWNNILSEGTDIREYLTKNSLEFLGDNKKLSEDLSAIRKELLILFKDSSITEEQIFQWIDRNIGQDTNTKTFVRALSAALVHSLLIANSRNQISLSEHFEEKLRGRSKFIQKYVDNKPVLELHCLFALQALAVELEHPPKLLDRIFSYWYSNEILSDDCFWEWKRDTDPQEQFEKGVCIASLKQFFDWLKQEQQGDEDSDTEEPAAAAETTEEAPTKQSSLQ